MDYRFDDHAVDQMNARRISQTMVDNVLTNPGQILPGKKGREVYQSKVVRHGTTFVLRVFVEPRLKPPLIISVYLTDNIGKYWREETYFNTGKTQEE